MAPSPTCQAEATAANVDAATKSAAWKMTVAPGSKIWFVTNQVITQVGVMEWYMAKVPAGHTATPWDGSGNVWFKINEDHPTFSPLNWPSSGMYFFLLWFDFSRKLGINTDNINRYPGSIHHDSSINPIGRISHPGWAHCLALGGFVRRSPVLYLL